jgi:hypothetical protein
VARRGLPILVLRIMFPNVARRRARDKFGAGSARSGAGFSFRGHGESRAPLRRTCGPYELSLQPIAERLDGIKDFSADFYVGRPVAALALGPQGAQADFPLSSNLVFVKIAGQKKGRGVF